MLFTNEPKWLDVETLKSLIGFFYKDTIQVENPVQKGGLPKFICKPELLSNARYIEDNKTGEEEEIVVYSDGLLLFLVNGNNGRILKASAYGKSILDGLIEIDTVEKIPADNIKHTLPIGLVSYCFEENNHEIVTSYIPANNVKPIKAMVNREIKRRNVHTKRWSGDKETK